MIFVFEKSYRAVKAMQGVKDSFGR